MWILGASDLTTSSRRCSRLCSLPSRWSSPTRDRRQSIESHLRLLRRRIQIHKGPGTLQPSRNHRMANTSQWVINPMSSRLRNLTRHQEWAQKRLQYDRDGKCKAMSEIRRAWVDWRVSQGEFAGASLTEFLQQMQTLYPMIRNPGSIKNAIKRWRAEERTQPAGRDLIDRQSEGAKLS